VGSSDERFPGRPPLRGRLEETDGSGRPLDDIPRNEYNVRMSRRLREELKQTKPFESLEQEVFLEIQRTAQVTARWVVAALKTSGLTPSQFNVLRILRGAGPEGLACGAVCERMVNHDPDLTRLLDRLEAAALVEKFRDAKDRRVVKARITKA